MEMTQSDAVAREVTAFCQHLNSVLSTYSELACYFPLNEDNLFEQLRDGVLLGYLLNHYYPGSLKLDSLVRGLDLSQINQVHTKVIFEVNANLNLIVMAAKSIRNLVIVNLGAEDILNCNRDLVLGLLWQIFNSKMSCDINLHAHPELVRLVESNETLANLAQLKPDALLNRWFNHHLEKSGSSRRASNFGRDLADSELYVQLMHRIAPKKVFIEDVKAILSVPADSQDGLLQRARMVADLAKRLGCQEFASPEDVVQGNSRLNFAFTATLFNKYIGLTLVSDDEVRNLRDHLDSMVAENTELKARSQAAEFDSKTTIERLEAELVAAKQSLESAQASNREQLDEQSRRFEMFKEELAAQYKDNLESALESERRAHQDELWELISQQKDACRQLVALSHLLRQQFSGPELERAKVLEPLEELQLESIIKELGELASLSGRKMAGLEIAAEHLKSSVAHKDKVNEVMGDKIREYTEQVINCKKDTNRRGSLLRRIFALEK